MSDSVRPHQAPRPWDSPGKTLEWVAADERTAFKSQPSGLVNGRLTHYMWQNGRGAKIHRTNKLDLRVCVCVCMYFIYLALQLYTEVKRGI